MKFVSLFSGIGGLDLGLERAGHECVLQVENDPYCQCVLAKHWPDVRRIADVKEVTANDCKEAEAIVGGFPCQPVSLAGRRQAQADPRWLWPWFHALVASVRPPYVVVENVPGLLSAGMAEVFGDLSALGYDAEWHRIAAETVGAPHLRWRVFIIAHARSSELRDESRRISRASRSGASVAGDDGPQKPVAYTESQREELWSPSGERSRRSTSSGDDVAHACGGRQRAEQQHLHAGQSDAAGSGTDVPNAHGESLGRATITRQERSHWLVEPDVGRVAHGVPKRVDRLRALGNAVVPQVAELVGRRLTELDESL